MIFLKDKQIHRKYRDSDARDLGTGRPKYRRIN